jgi:hypothetical protein
LSGRSGHRSDIRLSQLECHEPTMSLLDGDVRNDNNNVRDDEVDASSVTQCIPRSPDNTVDQCQECPLEDVTRVIPLNPSSGLRSITLPKNCQSHDATRQHSEGDVPVTDVGTLSGPISSLDNTVSDCGAMRSHSDSVTSEPTDEVLELDEEENAQRESSSHSLTVDRSPPITDRFISHLHRKHKSHNHKKHKKSKNLEQ